MALERFANTPTLSSPSTAWSTLSAGIDASVTSLTVASAAAFPASPQFRIVIGDELLLVTGVAGTTFTVSRGAESTTAASHSSGASVFHVLSAASLLRNPGALTTTGDVSYLDSSGAPARLAAGADGQYLRYLSGLPTASAILSGDLPDPLVVGTLRFTDTDLLRGDAAGQVTLSAGSNGTSFRLKNGANAELGAIYWDTANNLFVVGTQGAVGAGTARDVVLGSAVSAPNGIYLATEGTSRWQITPTGPLRPFADGTAAADLGDSSHKVRSAYLQKLGTLTSNGFVKTSGGDGTLSIDTTSYQAAGSYALTTSSLAQFAATTSLELKTLISDETGSGALVFGTSPTLVTPTLGVASGTTLTLTPSAATGLTITGATETTSQPLLSLTQTWNNAAVLFVGVDIAITKTAADAASAMFRVRNVSGGGGSFAIGASGELLQDLKVGKTGTQYSFYAGNGTNADTKLARDSGFGWTSSSGDASGTLDTILRRDGAANTLALRNSTNAQTFNLANTYTSSTNYEYWVTTWSSNILHLRTDKGSGGGTARAMQIDYGGTTTAAITVPATSGDIVHGAGLQIADATKILKTTVSFNNGAGSSVGTLTNAPAATNPTKWIPIDDNGTTRYIPAW